MRVAQVKHAVEAGVRGRRRSSSIVQITGDTSGSGSYPPAMHVSTSAAPSAGDGRSLDTPRSGHDSAVSACLKALRKPPAFRTAPDCNRIILVMQVSAPASTALHCHE